MNSDTHDETGRRRIPDSWEIIRNQAGMPRDTKAVDVYRWYHRHCAAQESRIYGRVAGWRWDEMSNDLTGLDIPLAKAEEIVSQTLGPRPQREPDAT